MMRYKTSSLFRQNIQQNKIKTWRCASAFVVLFFYYYFRISTTKNIVLRQNMTGKSKKMEKRHGYMTLFLLIISCGFTVNRESYFTFSWMEFLFISRFYRIPVHFTNSQWFEHQISRCSEIYYLKISKNKILNWIIRLQSLCAVLPFYTFQVNIPWFQTR